MAEAIDEAVAVIVSMVEAEARKGTAPASDLAAELVSAIEDRTEDAERRIARRERAEWNRAAIAELRHRRERLEVLWSRAGALALRKGGASVGRRKLEGKDRWLSEPAGATEHVELRELDGTK